MARFEVVKDSCANPRWEVWDTETTAMVAAYGDEALAEAEARRRNGAAE